MGGSPEFNSLYNNARKSKSVQYKPSSANIVESKANQVIDDIKKKFPDCSFGIDGGALWHDFMFAQDEARLELGLLLFSSSANEFNLHISKVADLLKKQFKKHRPYVE